MHLVNKNIQQYAMVGKLWSLESDDTVSYSGPQVHYQSDIFKKAIPSFELQLLHL